MKENNSPLENFKDEYEMVLLRDRIRQNKTSINYKMKVMTPENKSRLLKDLSARLIYGTIVSVTDGTIKYNAYIESISYKYIQVSPVNDSNFTPYTFYKICDIKPYLRPMSSMTEEEEKEYLEIIGYKGEDEDGWIRCDSIHTKWGVCPDGCAKLLDYLNSIHIDYRGLIEKGLAIEVTEENNPYKE